MMSLPEHNLGGALGAVPARTYGAVMSIESELAAVVQRVVDERLSEALGKLRIGGEPGVKLFYGTAEAAKALGVAQVTVVAHYIKRGLLKASKRPNSHVWQIAHEDLLAFKRAYCGLAEPERTPAEITRKVQGIVASLGKSSK